MIQRKKWSEFRSTGLLLVVNQILQVFGWSIVFSVDEKDNSIVKEVYPAKVKYKGFSRSDVTESHKRILRYLNIDDKNKELK